MNFETATYDQQTHHLTTLAQAALRHWGIPAERVTLAAYTNNAVFRVETGATTYALRVHRPDAKPLAWLKSERMWLQALSDDLRVPRPVGTIYAGELAGHNGTVYCSLTTWLTGAPPTLETLTAERAAAVGRWAGRLHATPFTPPPDFERPRLDWHGLFMPGGAYDPGMGMRHFSAEALDVIAAVTTKLKGMMDAQPLTLIHADLIAKNLLFDDAGTLGVVDFDECAWGYALYDLTPLIWLARGMPQAATIREALWAGYTAVHPDADRALLEDFVMARHVASCRWVAGNADHPAIRGRAKAIITERLHDMRQYLDGRGTIPAEHKSTVQKKT